MEWLVASPVANAMNGPEWAFPVVQSLHFIGFAFLIGTIAIVDLRLLGLGMPACIRRLSSKRTFGRGHGWASRSC